MGLHPLLALGLALAIPGLPGVLYAGYRAKRAYAHNTAQELQWSERLTCAKGIASAGIALLAAWGLVELDRASALTTFGFIVIAINGLMYFLAHYTLFEGTEHGREHMVEQPLDRISAYVGQTAQIMAAVGAMVYTLS